MTLFAAEPAVKDSGPSAQLQSVKQTADRSMNRFMSFFFPFNERQRARYARALSEIEGSCSLALELP